MIKLRFSLLCSGLLVLTGCASPPKGWSSKREIEQTVARNIHLGDSKEKVQEFMTKEGIKWHESFYGPLAPTSRGISGWVVVGRRWPITYEAGVSFSIGKDGTVDRITVVEEATGP